MKGDNSDPAAIVLALIIESIIKDAASLVTHTNDIFRSPFPKATMTPMVLFQNKTVGSMLSLFYTNLIQI
jgi:hypothetical protein